MKMTLFHGRARVDEDLDDWGPAGPSFDFLALRWTYGHQYVLFASLEACETVRAATGWKEGPFEYSLEVAVLDDCVATTPATGDMYYGDWSVEK